MWWMAAAAFFVALLVAVPCCIVPVGASLFGWDIVDYLPDSLSELKEELVQQRLARNAAGASATGYRRLLAHDRG